MPFTAWDSSGAPTSSTPSSSGGAGGPVGSRCVLDLGAFATSNFAANSAFTYQFTQANDANLAASLVTHDIVRLTHPMQVVAWQLQQYSASGTQQFQLCKNRTSAAQNVIYTNSNAGNATVNGFPGNNFSGTLGTALSFAAGDTISAIGQYSSGTSCAVKLLLTIEWT